MSSMHSNKNQEESEESEFTAASALACLASDRDESGDTTHEDSNQSDEEGFSIPQRFTKSGRKRAVPFTIKLMKVLSDKQYAHIITWMPSGKSFNILKPKAFVADILPQHFKTAKYSSFTRKLHRWGFMRHYRGEEAGAFYHKDFQRGRLDLVEEMTCHKAEPPKSAAAKTAFVAAPADSPKMPAAVPVKPMVVRPTPVAVPKRTLHTMAPPVTSKALPTINMPSGLVGASNALGLPPMASSLTTATPAVVSAALESERLNAAIEREVNRRLKERINAVALSRQAFALSALRQQQLLNSHHSTDASPLMQALLLQKQADLLKNTSASALPLGVTPLLPSYRAQGQPLPPAPTKHIQGARTA